MNDKPILIIGPPRSGTTLLATMLNSHPEIFVANEAKVFVRLLPRMEKEARPLDEQTAREILTGLEHNELYYLAPLPGTRDIFQHEKSLNAVAFIRALFRKIALREGKSRWGEKTAVAYRQLPLIRSSFPDAVYLGLERDPYEIAASYMKVNPRWGALGAIIHWLDFRRAVAAQGPKFDFLMVSYKALVTDPEATLTGVCEFIGEIYDGAMLDFHKTGRASTLAADETFKGPAKPLYRAPAPPEQLRRGLTGFVIRRLIQADPIQGQRAGSTSLLYIFVKVWVYIQAVLWELMHRLKRE